MKILEKIKDAAIERLEDTRDEFKVSYVFAKQDFNELWYSACNHPIQKTLKLCWDKITGIAEDVAETTFDLALKSIIPILFLGLPLYCYRNEIDDGLIHRSRPWMSIERARTFNSRDEKWDKFQVTLSSREKGKNLSEIILYNDNDEIKFSKRIDSDKAVISFEKQSRSYWTEPSVYLQVIDEEGNMNYRYFGKAWYLYDIELKTIPAEQEETK